MNRNLKDFAFLVGPLLLFVCMFLLLPVLGTAWISLWKDISFAAKEFIGLDNYQRLLGDEEFYQSLAFTILFVIASVALEMILGVLVALVIHEQFRGRGLVRGAMLIPWAVPAVIGARIWQLMYRYDYGVINYFVRLFGGEPYNFLGTATGGFLSLVFADVWRTTPFVAVIVLAGLQIIPKELYEQAMIDGAGLLRRFVSVTLTSIKPILVVALLFRTIDALRVFDIIYVITGGGPGGSTASLSIYAHQYYLLGDFGYGAAVSIILFLIAFATAVLYVKAGRFSESGA